MSDRKATRDARDDGDLPRDRPEVDDALVRQEIERLRREGHDEPPSAEDRLRRVERIAERDPLSRRPGYDVEKARALEDLEIRTNPEGFLRRHLGEGLDPATEHEVHRALRERESRADVDDRRNK